MNKQEKLDQLHKEAKLCTRCRLHRTRTHVVFGEGNSSAAVMFVGEAPGKQEDRTGRPFVGPAGRVMTEMLDASGLGREAVYLTSVVKSRPPDNRNPRQEEIRACLPFVKKQIDIIQPRIICALGLVAAHALLETREPLSHLREKAYPFASGKLIATYHPAAARRNPQWRKKAFADMETLKAMVHERK